MIGMKFAFPLLTPCYTNHLALLLLLCLFAVDGKKAFRRFQHSARLGLTKVGGAHV